MRQCRFGYVFKPWTHKWVCRITAILQSKMSWEKTWEHNYKHKIRFIRFKACNDVIQRSAGTSTRRKKTIWLLVFTYLIHMHTFLLVPDFQLSSIQTWVAPDFWNSSALIVYFSDLVHQRDWTLRSVFTPDCAGPGPDMRALKVKWLIQRVLEYLVKFLYFFV